MRRFQIFAILGTLVLTLAAFAYYYGFAITVILIVSILNYTMSMKSFKTLKKLIVESQNVLGENDKKLLKKIQSLEDKVDG
jgi:hypothetical protein